MGVLRSRFRHQSVALESGRLTALLVFGLIALGAAAAYAAAVIIGVMAWVVREGWRAWRRTK